MRTYQNYHRHSHYTNVRISDSVTKNEDYAKRAVELGHKLISTCEHGTQGRYIEGYELANKYDLKWAFGVEAYWVKDRFEKDSTNAHICLFARTENARQCLNDTISESNITGFYYRPRFDLELLFSLPREEVIVTTACKAFWQYEDIDDIVLRLNDYFKYFYLEVQNHNTDSQRRINSHILDLSKKHNIPIIMGIDSHYITDKKAWERDDYLASKGMFYDDEQGWYMDYPDGDTAYQRFIEQGVLSPEQIDEAMGNTNIFLEIEEYNSPIFNKEIKMPTLEKVYPNTTQRDRDIIYCNLIKQQWKAIKESIPKELHSLYKQEITKEVKDVLTTKHANYFLLDYEIIKRGLQKGGMLTNSGRGSGVSYFTNKLLGFTKIDRISAKVKMYPERFISPTRIIESKSLADLDMNLGDPETFAEAQTEILGAEHSYPMIAYGTYKAKSAFKMYAKAKNMNFDLANEISQQIEEYEKALKYAEDDEIDDINIYDYVEEKYHSIIKDSEEYLGIISDLKNHPCAYLIYEGNIRKEIGLIKTKSKSGKERLCTIMDGKWAEDYKFLKNDLLKVDVVKIIKQAYKRLEMPEHDEQELIKLCEGNQKVWDIYKYGWTMGINQCEKSATKHKAMKYQPQNISELCAFVAAIRPSFKSMYNIFEKREPFEYGVKVFDDIIQTEEMKASFILYQEQIMAALNFAGVPMAECYDVIKNISKKREEKVKAYKDIFLQGFAHKVMEIDQKSQEEAEEISNQIWTIISNSCQYGFNASHAYSVAIDSLYGAYLKSHYPLYFYEVFLNVLFEKTNAKDRITQAKQEALKAFGIQTVPMRFGQDNRKFTLDEKSNSINSALSSIKGMGNKIAPQIYELRDNNYEHFVNLLADLKEKTSCNKGQIEDLIKLNYFQKWGNNQKLLDFYQFFQVFYQKNQFSKEKAENFQIALPLIKKYSRETAKKYMDLNTNILLQELFEIIENKKLDIQTQIKEEIELLGYTVSKYKVPNDVGIITEMNLDYTPKIKFYMIATGETKEIKIYKKNFFSTPTHETPEKKQLLHNFDIVQLGKIVQREKSRKGNENIGEPQWVKLGEYEDYIDTFSVIKPYQDNSNMIKE